MVLLPIIGSNLVLYTSIVCPYAQRARIALEEVYGPGSYEAIEVDFDQKPAWYVEQINPSGQVPALAVGDDIFTESMSIVAFMADCSENADYPLMPSDPLARARERRFVDRFTSLVIVHLKPIYMHREVFRVPSLLSGIRSIQELLPGISGGSSLVLCDRRFTFADIAVAPFLGRMYALAKAGLIPDVYDALTTDPTYTRFNDYAQSLFSRQSFRDTFADEKALVERASQCKCIG